VNEGSLFCGDIDMRVLKKIIKVLLLLFLVLVLGLAALDI